MLNRKFFSHVTGHPKSCDTIFGHVTNHPPSFLVMCLVVLGHVTGHPWSCDLIFSHVTSYHRSQWVWGWPQQYELVMSLGRGIPSVLGGSHTPPL